MDLAASAVFLRQKLDSEHKKQLVGAMAKFVKEAFKENVNNADWLDEESRMQILEKIDAMTILAGKSDSTSLSLC